MSGPERRSVEIDVGDGWAVVVQWIAGEIVTLAIVPPQGMGLQGLVAEIGNADKQAVIAALSAAPDVAE